jgi:DNA-binding NarL/FixJ family response regulator
MMRSMLASQLEAAGFEVGTASTGSDARRLCAIMDPDALIMDIDLGTGMSGLDVADALLAEFPHLTVLYLTHLPDPRFAGRLSESLPTGVGYVRKESLVQPGFLIEALDAVLRGTVEADHRQDLDPKRPLTHLSRTQIGVLSLMAKGYSNAEIAQARGTTSRAVQSLIARSFPEVEFKAAADSTERMQLARDFLQQAGITLPTQETE